MKRIRLRKVAYLVGFMSEETLDFRAWAHDPIGWACRQPEIQRLGLSLVPMPDGTSEPEYEGLYGWPAVARFFDLTEEEAQSIFDALAYWDLPRDPVPSDVSKRIREFLTTADARRVGL
jgi:hypothetical protein